MLAWTQRSRTYEINTWVWLYELSRRHQRHIHLRNIPAQDWNGLGLLGVDTVWLMGVWERSPAGIAISMRNEGLLEDFRRVLPDFSPEDNVGRPIVCVVMSWTSIWVDRPDWLQRGSSWPTGGCA